ncbi:ABC transporter substrate-binding protein [Peribacillus simplex]|uniref:Iron citrate ABC transporter substrate-binding protein n=1 Tax=Peribacillus simplex NBRC 15720 = DSM 1321 TaxID=1349754 RepID=A0A223EJR2_9BACI|nr:Fe(3+) dicitrate ABC transporter substrate-binding protein [Peribacillus simplex]ASS95481.1 iron citrate ABC transporter substrate-binding protein [Peribacillus simplex NBRC 15720 = DSM 1321]MEC1398052.1 Fe(3+) dicitrate ABC transporter substrate-binding protein [Peribacillus simplex]MED3909477.1 Fe(3+) dicitrate ABC transporter substrate-binding protein [Peribacillus simplex]
MRESRKVRTFGGGALILLFTIMMMLSGCNNSQKTTEAEKTSAETSNQEVRTIKHEMGETEIKNTPKKIVTLELSFVDSLNALGIKPIGISDDNKKDMITKLVGQEIDYTSVGTREQPNLEVISSLQPDLIIADAERHKGIYKDLQQIAPTVVLKSRESTYQENLDSFKTIAKAVNQEDAAENRLSEHEKTIKELKSKLTVDSNMTVLPAVVRDTSFQAHTSSSYDGELLERMGLKNAIQQEQPHAEMNLEQLVEINPDVLLLANNEGKLLTDEWKDNPLWKDLKAVKNGQVYSVDRDLWTRYRGVVSAEAIAKDTLNMLGEE